MKELRQMMAAKEEAV
jgi:hypothetical protein